MRAQDYLLQLLHFLLSWCFTSTETVWRMRAQAYLPVHTALELSEVAGESAGNTCEKDRTILLYVHRSEVAY